MGFALVFGRHDEIACAYADVPSRLKSGSEGTSMLVDVLLQQDVLETTRTVQQCIL